MSPLLSLWAIIALAGFSLAIEPFAVVSSLNLTGVNSTANFNYVSSQGSTGSFSVISLSQTSGRGPAAYISPPVNPSNSIYLNSTYIALIPCNSTDGQNVDFDPATVAFQYAMQQNVYSILLYSTSAKGCILTGTFDPSDIGNVYTLISAEDATTLLSVQSSSTAPLIGAFGGPSVLRYNASQVTNAPTSTPTPPPGPTGYSAPIAIIVLAILAGLLAVLLGMFGFKTIQRARGNPERYGPRAGTGRRPPQTRAHGLARAMLDTLPIVKFAAPAPEPENKDVELADRGPSVDAPATTEAATAAPLPQRPDPAHLAAADQGICCSICTDDFEAGQDTRVLPCGHRFHPACIDPWLVGFSVSCPLCRVDVDAHLAAVKTEPEPPRRESREEATGSSADR